MNHDTREGGVEAPSGTDRGDRDTPRAAEQSHPPSAWEDAGRQKTAMNRAPNRLNTRAKHAHKPEQKSHDDKFPPEEPGQTQPQTQSGEHCFPEARATDMTRIRETR